MGLIQLLTGMTLQERIAAHNSNNNYLDTDKAKKSVVDELIAGWRSDTNAFTYYSADNPVFVMKIPGDQTSRYYPGVRVKLTQTTVKYFIVLASSYDSTNTSITLYGGTDYTLANATISGVYSAPPKTYPFGFPMNPGKWTVEVVVTDYSTQSSPAANTWYNVGSRSITVPVGAWSLGYSGVFQSVKSAAPSTIFATLSSSNNTESDSRFSINNYVSASSVVEISGSRQNNVTLSSKTIYYLNLKTDQSGASSIDIPNSAPLVLRAVSNYL